MKLTLDIKREFPWFWLPRVRRARTDRYGTWFHEVYEQTRHRTGHVELNLLDSSRVKAYCLGMKKPHDEGIHVSFAPCENESSIVDDTWLRLTITNARQIDFTGYQPKTGGGLANRPWVFASYLLDRIPI